MCHETPVISAGFQANISRLRISRPHNSFLPSSVKGCSTSDPETIVHSSGINLLLCSVTAPPAIGNFSIP
ncbi:hypothetical protein Tco_0358366 [Tanacetum coccineum]